MKMVTCIPVGRNRVFFDARGSVLNRFQGHLPHPTFYCLTCVKEQRSQANGVLSTHIERPLRVNITHKKRIKIEQINKLMKKTIANHEKIVYACMRYPILVWHTVLVQNI
jgi:hypothetical protein